MKRFKSTLGILLALIMVLALLPVGVAKADGGYLTVCNTAIDLSQNGSYFDGKVVFEIIDGKNVLTLNDYKLENYNSGSGISASGIDLTIVGSAEIGVTGATSSAIIMNGNLTLNGDFTLRAQCVTGTTFFVIGNLTVEGGALDVENTYEGKEAIFVDECMTVNDGTVHAKANGAAAINAFGGINLNNGEMYLSGDASASEVFIGKKYPLWVGGKQVTSANQGDIFGDGTAKFEVTEEGRNVLTLTNANITGTYIDESGTSANILSMDNSFALTINSVGENTVKGGQTAIDVPNLTLTGTGSLYAENADTSYGAAICSSLNMIIDGTTVQAKSASSFGLQSLDTMTVQGESSVIAEGKTGAVWVAHELTLQDGMMILDPVGGMYIQPDICEADGTTAAKRVEIGVPVEHTVTVVGGTADKTSAKAGDTVTITADDATGETAFLQWEMLEDVEFARGDALTTTFKMPNHDVTVTSVYRAILISDIDDQTYTGEEITLTFGRNDLTLDGVDFALENGTDYSLTYANNVDAGTATVTVTFHDRVTKKPDVRMGTKSKTFRIRPASIAAAEIAEIAEQTYQGKALTPEPTVTWNGRTLEKDKDYTLQYFNNVNVGTNAFVMVKGKGNFDENSDVGRSFRIIPAPLTITAIDQEYIYNGYQQGEGDTVYATPAEIAQKVTVEGLQGDDKLTSIILDGQATEPDTYPGRIQPSNAVIGNATGTVTENYEITYVPGKLTIKLCYYTITFVNEDGTELQSGEVLMNETPEYTGEMPEKAPTVAYLYMWAGWKDQNGETYGAREALPAVTADTTYTAIFDENDRIYTGPEWTWTGYEKAEATFTAADDTTFTQTREASITHRTTTAATCEGEGVETYTATVTFLGKAYSNDKPKTLEPIKHKWGTPTYVWEDIPDGCAATATVLCENDPTHKITETVAGTFTAITPPTTRTEGLGRYTAVFSDEHFTAQTKDVPIPKLQPTYYIEHMKASDMLTYADGMTLYRCDVKIKNVDEAIKAISAQIYVTYDDAALTLTDVTTTLEGNSGIHNEDGTLSFAWATDGAGVALPDGTTVLSLYFLLNNPLPDGTVLPFGFTVSEIGTHCGLAYLNADGGTQEANPVYAEDGSMTFTVPNELTIAGELAYASEAYEFVDGEALYRYDVRVKDLPEAGLMVNSAQIFLAYDPAKLILRKTEGLLDWTATETETGVMCVWAADTETLLKNDDVVLTLRFKMGAVETGETVPITFTENALGYGSAMSVLFGGKVTDIEAATMDGSLTFDLLCGDANCDGKVTAADAALILRSLVGLDELSAQGMLNADANLDGEISASDAAAILRFIVGLIASLPA